MAPRVIRLELYVAGCVLRAVVLAGFALVALFSLLEFVDQLGAVGQGHYTIGDALLYAGLTIPARLLQISPVAMLLGTLLGLGLLSRQSELTVMQSFGVSAARIVGAVLKLAIPIVVILLLAAEYLVPAAQSLAESQRQAAVSAGSSILGQTGFWAQKNGSFLSVQTLYGDIPANINIYSFAADGTLVSATHAVSAVVEHDGTWQLRGVTQETLNPATRSQFEVRHLPGLVWPGFIRPSEIRLLMLPPNALPPLALFNYIGVLDQRHQQAIRYRQALWSTICIPVSMLAMVMVAAAFVFSAARARSAGQQMIIGGVLGVGFLFLQQIIAYLVLLLNLDPAPATLALPVLLSAAAITQFRDKQALLFLKKKKQKDFY
jgi:lipopolysaccharide export system permease protein